MNEKPYIRWKAMLIDPTRIEPLAVGEGRTTEKALASLQARLRFVRAIAQSNVDRFDAAAADAGLKERERKP